MLRVGDKTVCFAGEDSVCSNLAPFNLSTELGAFSSTEQAYHFVKLRWLGLHTAAAAIREFASPKFAMLWARAQLQSEISQGHVTRARLEEWDETYARQVIMELAVRKMRQYDAFRDLLVANVDKLFVEATIDPKWGVGLHTAAVRSNSEAWLLQHRKGQNRFGEILDDVSVLAVHYQATGQYPAPLDLTWF